MKNASEKLEEFMRIANDGLAEKLGCVLFQLPPSFKYTEENLENILKTVPAKKESVVEFRHESWWDEKVYEAFRQQGITFCNNDYPGLPNRIIKTEPLFYMRFHGRPELYKSEYNAEHLKMFTRHVPPESEERYVFFNNTWFLAAITNAMAARELLDKTITII
jgi:uncharacterized protein YecE (DUF72 family)